MVWAPLDAVAGGATPADAPGSDGLAGPVLAVVASIDGAVSATVMLSGIRDAAWPANQVARSCVATSSVP